ncbi:MAG: hypothetical protein PHW60_02595 [Kiritimatiellae bacterium]|nr:hypothetical protein [Kiritimatiellia bacterium]
MNRKSTGVRITPFALGIMCFVLPFVQISCDGKKAMQFTGVQLVTGSEMKEPMGGETKKIPPEPFAIVTLLALAVGIGFCASPKRAMSVSAAIAGGIAVISMFVMKTRMDAEITKEASGMPITIEYPIGFWLVCLAAIAGVILAIMRIKDKGTANQAADTCSPQSPV